MKYEVIVVEHPHKLKAQLKLQEKVNELLKDGWDVNGGVSVSAYVFEFTQYYVLAQSMIKDE